VDDTPSSANEKEVVENDSCKDKSNQEEEATSSNIDDDDDEWGDFESGA